MIRGDTLQFGMEFTGLEGDLDSAYLTMELTPGVYKYDLEVSAGGDTWTVPILASKQM